MEIQVQILQVKAMETIPIEEKIVPSSSITPLANKPQQSQLRHKEVPHCELDINECICVFNNHMSIGIGG